jgi:predicted HicB family RNase H-like nuclease
MATMDYKGYVGTVVYDDTDEIFHGRVINVADTITFQGRSVKELRAALRGSVEDYIAMCEEDGVKP